MRRLPPLVLLAALLAGCGGGGDDDEVAVAAAASLTDAFTAIGEAYEADHEGVEVTFTFDSSGTLSDQIVAGAPVDVFASADEVTMAEVADELAGAPATFARNRLVIVTKPGNPEGIARLADLADAGTVSLCAEGAPCGRLAGEVLAGAGVEIPEGRISRGQDVRATLTAVAEGDAVAAIVYVTDAAAAGDRVEAVPIPDEQNAVAAYPIAAVTDDEAAADLVAFVLSEEGRAILAEHGFLPPR